MDVPTAFANRLDHIVVIMFENRSFDTLLGNLYAPGDVPQFDGVVGRGFSNGVPAGADAADQGPVMFHLAANRHTPDPDPGEEYPHVNTQLFGTVDPETNRQSEVDYMRAPFNAPPDPVPAPTMSGFVEDYIGAFTVEMGRAPTRPEYSQIMAGYSPNDLPVVSALARHFAVFDRWFCEVPSQTYPNRSFFHAASSSGLVVNWPPGKFESRNTAPTIFERLEAAGRTWHVYYDPLQLVSATALIHASRLAPYFATHFSTTDDFYEHARDGALPNYAFIEPNMLHPHTDMHPPGAARLRHDLHIPPADSMVGGEDLLARVYDAVRTSSKANGSNWANTLLLVTFDEHGGTYDHVPPPAVPAPDPGGPTGEMGFRFDRSGVRIPTIAISAWVDAKTVVHDEFRSTSMIRTLRERWALGPPLTQRDAVAPDLAAVLNRPTPRPPEEWPSVPESTLRGAISRILELGRPLSRLEKALVGEALAHEARVGNAALRGDVRAMSRREAVDHLTRIRERFFPLAGARERRSTSG